MRVVRYSRQADESYVDCVSVPLEISMFIDNLGSFAKTALCLQEEIEARHIVKFLKFNPQYKEIELILTTHLAESLGHDLSSLQNSVIALELPDSQRHENNVEIFAAAVASILGEGYTRYENLVVVGKIPRIKNSSNSATSYDILGDESSVWIEALSQSKLATLVPNLWSANKALLFSLIETHQNVSSRFVGSPVVPIEEVLDATGFSIFPLHNQESAYKQMHRVILIASLFMLASPAKSLAKDYVSLDEVEVEKSENFSPIPGYLIAAGPPALKC